MNSRLRRILFWMHLGAGVTVGLIVATMATTGAAMSFEAQILHWAEGPSRALNVPPATPQGAAPARLPIDEILARVRAARPGAAVSALTVPADPAQAVRISLGREEPVHVDPYTGAVQPVSGQGVRAAFALLIRVHRYLGGATPEGREVGKTITGIANASFSFLVLSGLVLWWPAKLSKSALRAGTWFRRGLSGRARDWSWHNVIGFWALPVLLIITTSGMVMSYRPVSNLVFRLAGETPPAPGGGGGTTVPKPSPDARPLALEPMLADARNRVPGWTSLTVRMRTREAKQEGARPAQGGVDAVTVSVKGPAAGPRFANVQLVFDPFTGSLVKDERFANFGPGRRARTWMRYLHTGEALGPVGQLLNGAAAVGVLFLVYTGFAMALHRLRRWRAQAARRVSPSFVETQPSP